MTASKRTDKKPENESLFKWFLQVIVLALVFLGAYFLVFRFVLSNEIVSGSSMEPTFKDGDRLIANRNPTINRYDVVVLDAPDSPGTLYIKRVIGLPGDTISSKNDVTYINGKAVKEPYLDEYKKDLPEGQQFTADFSLQSIFGVEKVPADSYFVMGDNRNVSRDSRMIGFIKKSAIEGKVKFRYFPFTRMQFY